MKIAVLIPAYNPGEKFLDVLHELIKTEIPLIVVVNDGCSDEYEEIFGQIKTLPKVTLLDHPENQGKGAALKTGLNYLLAQGQQIEGVVTADADGQHATPDIIKVAQEIQAHPEALILGGRRFDKDVPWKSMAGNTITRWVLKLFFGLNIYDSQTGLRGVPWALIPLFTDIPYNRYEYELEMLMICKHEGIPIHEITIQTIYLDQNRASHFNPFKDSTRIYFVLFRYTIASLVTSGIDYIVFIITYGLTKNVWSSIFCARLVAVIVNYILVRNAVFYSKANLLVTFPRYILLVIIFGFTSAYTIEFLNELTNMPVILAKVVVEVFLFFIIFLLQKGFVFWEKQR